MRYTIKHSFDIDEQNFWDKLFFDEAYNKALFADHLKFGYQVLQYDREPDGSVRRRVECTPPIELPAVVKKVVGESTAYVEDGRFDPKTRRFTVDIVPKVGADMSKNRAVLWVEARGPKRCERIVDIDSTVKVFAVGKVIEAFIEKQTRATYDAAAAFTQKWIAEKGL